MDDPFDPERLRLPQRAVITGPRRDQSGHPRPKPKDKFLKGPIPWPWLTRAASLPGRALHVAKAIWFRSGLTRSSRVRLSLSALEEEMGVRRDAASRGLKALEQAALIQVERHSGRRPAVTILAWEQE